MKFKNVRIILGLIFPMLIFLGLPVFKATQTIQSTTSQIFSVSTVEEVNLGSTPQNKLSSSYDYNLTGSSIFIDDSDPNYNWSKTRDENPWCTGSGTWHDPYIIESVYIDGLGAVPPTPGKIHSKNCLSIYSSTAYFIVKDCYFHNAGGWEYNSGIYLRTVQNGMLVNNTVNYCHEGIYVDWYSESNTLHKNLLISDHFTAGYGKAVKVSMESHNNTFSGNYVLNYYDGINIFDSNTNVIKKNYVKNILFGHEVETGIYLGRSHYCKVVSNQLAGDYVMQNFTIDSTGSTGNIIINNTVIESDVTSKIHSSAVTNLIALDQSNYNTVAHNMYIIERESTTHEDTPAIPGYNIFLFIGIVSVISIFIILKRRVIDRK